MGRGSAALFHMVPSGILRSSFHTVDSLTITDQFSLKASTRLGRTIAQMCNADRDCFTAVALAFPFRTLTLNNRETLYAN
jgi:hypothetical protein